MENILEKRFDNDAFLEPFIGTFQQKIKNAILTIHESEID